MSDHQSLCGVIIFLPRIFKFFFNRTIFRRRTHTLRVSDNGSCRRTTFLGRNTPRTLCTMHYAPPHCIGSHARTNAHTPPRAHDRCTGHRTRGTYRNIMRYTAHDYGYGVTFRIAYYNFLFYF